MEVAASARQKGVEVALVELEEVPLSRALGREAGEIYAGLHRERGVEMHTGVAVARVEGKGRVERVVLADGTALDADLLVCGLGAIPRTALAERAGLAVENGVGATRACRPATRTCSPPATSPTRAPARRPPAARRALGERAAPAAVAARAMLGRPRATTACRTSSPTSTTSAWSTRGWRPAPTEFEIRGDTERYEFVAHWRREGRLIAAMNVNVWDVAEGLAEEILSRAT